ncbi:hypothetical protein BOTBODRAFT_39747 [Botryobasidium botryosum FD-172 SS1]|uniref:Uncharacterized protein n=1 Tax=Botryobasidium botryosum (strain FD-172 SS1) TaxID=930990 RepID=A0A067LSJ7_BOTB1|nr:hypothetical protein BOTBODRAFT_39747 [Botryobasidium botryosum FD-172 SS1]
MDQQGQEGRQECPAIYTDEWVPFAFSSPSPLAHSYTYINIAGVVSSRRPVLPPPLHIVHMKRIPRQLLPVSLAHLHLWIQIQRGTLSSHHPGRPPAAPQCASAPRASTSAFTRCDSPPAPPGAREATRISTCIASAALALRREQAFGFVDRLSCFWPSAMFIWAWVSRSCLRQFRSASIWSSSCL